MMERSHNRMQKGFSLLEMVVVLAIVAIMTAIILGNLPGFRDNISIDLVAQQVALAIRETQVYSMAGKSVSNIASGETISKLWGISFSTSPNTGATPNSKTFESFYFEPGEEVEQNHRPEMFYSLEGRIYVKKLRLGGSEKDNLEIKFQRRYPEPLCFGSVNAFGSYDCGQASSVEVVLCSPSENRERIVQVSNNGQIIIIKPQNNGDCQ